MPKQTLKIQGFHGGINSNSDPRDIQDIESPDLVDVNIDALGRIKTLGVGVESDANTNTLGILSNQGLFVMPSDRKVSDGSESNENLIFVFNDTSNKIDVLDSAGNWVTDVITLANGMTDLSHYIADGHLRIFESGFAVDSQSNKFYGYLDYILFAGLNAKSGIISLGWTDSNQEIAKPSIGKCQISTPFTADDTNGVNSSSSEYIGNFINDGGTTDTVILPAVNLRVGLQYNTLLENLAGNFSEITNCALSNDNATYAPLIADNNIQANGNASTTSVTQIGDNNGQTFSLDENKDLVFPFLINTAEYADFERVTVSAFTSGSAEYISWAFEKSEIIPDVWNVLVCSLTNNRDGDYSPGDTLTIFRIAVLDSTSSDSPTFWISGPVVQTNCSLNGFQPGLYNFHHTYLYDELKQESLPSKFDGAGNAAGNGNNVNSINIVGGAVLFNFDTYISPWSNFIACNIDVSDNQIDKSSHGLKAGDEVIISGEDVTGIDNDTIYFVSSQTLETNSFRLSTTYANALAGTSITLSGSDDSAVHYQVYGLNKRTTGSRIYYKLQENDNYFLIGELDFVNKGFKWFPEGDSMSYDMANSSHPVTSAISKTFVLVKNITPNSANIIDTFKSINGFSGSTKNISAKAKTAVVQGRRAYIGNIQTGSGSEGVGEKFPDRILKSQVNKFDVFPDSLGKVDVAINDGESIIKLEAFADRILQFKERTLYIINVSENVDFLEDTYQNKGCGFKYHVTKTDFGIAWFNSFGVYFYDGREVSNLLEKNNIRMINESDWEAFITNGEDGSADDTTMADAHIGYIPKKRQLLIKNKNKNVFIYDFVLKAWMKGSVKIPITTAMTNFAIDGDQNLFYINAGDSGKVTWDPSPSSSTAFIYKTKDIDFGEPGVRKKIYKVYVSYKTGGATNVQIKYDTNGETSFNKVFQNGTNFTSNVLDNAGGGEWTQAILKPNTSSEATNIYSFALKFSSTGTGSEITRVQCVNDSSDSLNGKYFDIYGETGKTQIWIDTDNSGTSQPTGSGSYAANIEVTEIETNDNANSVAIAVASAIDDHADFNARVEQDTVIITDAASASRTNASDGDTGFTISVDKEGGTSSIPSTFAINDITIVYRLKSIR